MVALLAQRGNQFFCFDVVLSLMTDRWNGVGTELWAVVYLFLTKIVPPASFYGRIECEYVCVIRF